MYLPYLSYSVTSWWASRWIPFLNECDESSGEHRCTGVYTVGCRVLWVYAQELDIQVKGYHLGIRERATLIFCSNWRSHQQWAQLLTSQDPHQHLFCILIPILAGDPGIIPLGEPLCIVWEAAFGNWDFGARHTSPTCWTCTLYT